MRGVSYPSPHLVLLISRSTTLYLHPRRLQKVSYDRHTSVREADLLISDATAKWACMASMQHPDLAEDLDGNLVPAIVNAAGDRLYRLSFIETAIVGGLGILDVYPVSRRITLACCSRQS